MAVKQAIVFFVCLSIGGIISPTSAEQSRFPIPGMALMLENSRTAMQKAITLEGEAAVQWEKAMLEIEMARQNVLASDQQYREAWSNQTMGFTELQEASNRMAEASRQLRRMEVSAKRQRQKNRTLVAKFLDEARQAEYQAENIRETWVSEHGPQAVQIAQESRENYENTLEEFHYILLSARVRLEKTLRTMAIEEKENKELRQKERQNISKLMKDAKEKGLRLQETKSHSEDLWGQEMTSHEEMLEIMHQREVAEKEAAVAKAKLETLSIVSQARQDSQTGKLASLKRQAEEEYAQLQQWRQQTQTRMDQIRNQSQQAAAMASLVHNPQKEQKSKE